MSRRTTVGNRLKIIPIYIRRHSLRSSNLLPIFFLCQAYGWSLPPRSPVGGSKLAEEVRIKTIQNYYSNPDLKLLGGPSSRFFPECARSSSRVLSSPDGEGARDEDLVCSRGQPDGRAHQGRGRYRGRQRLLLGPSSRGAQGGGGGRDLEAGR